MVIDPILNKTLVGSERYRTVQPQPQQQPPAFKNAATCLDLDDTEIPCDPAMCYTWEGYEMDSEKKKKLRLENVWAWISEYSFCFEQFGWQFAKWVVA